MSVKVPVGATIDEAFQFGLHRWGAIARFIWVPLILGIILMTGYAVAVIDFAAAKAAESAATMESLKTVFKVPLATAIGGAMLLGVVMLFFVSGAFASLFRLVALGEERPGLFHLRFDGPALRVFFALLILGALNLIIFCVAVAVALALTGGSLTGAFDAFMNFIALAEKAEAGGSPPPMEAMVAFGTAMKPLVYGWLLSLIPTIYISVKLAPFPAGSAAENRLLLFGSFAMTFGHAWSIFFVYLLFFIAIIILSVIFSLGTTIIEMLANLATAQGGAIGALGGVVLLLVFLASLWFQFFTMSVQYAIPAIIYRRLRTGQ